MQKIFGEFETEQAKSQEFLIMGFSPDLSQQQWRNNGLSADFLADYLSTFFPLSDTEPTTLKRKKELKAAISHIANELLENAMKFNDKNSDYPIILQVQLYHDHLTLYIINSISPESLKNFQSFLPEFLNTEPQEFYIRQIKRAEKDESMMTSRLGLLTIIDDYNAKLGWKFETVQQIANIENVNSIHEISKPSILNKLALFLLPHKILAKFHKLEVIVVTTMVQLTI